MSTLGPMLLAISESFPFVIRSSISFFMTVYSAVPFPCFLWYSQYLFFWGIGVWLVSGFVACSLLLGHRVFYIAFHSMCTDGNVDLVCMYCCCYDCGSFGKNGMLLFGHGLLLLCVGRLL